MSLKDWFAAVDADRKTRTRTERHGSGELTLWDDLPLSAKGCLLPDGTMTDADCLVPGTAISSDAARVWTRRLPGTALRRRGRVAVETGTALRFVDEPAADAPACLGRLEPKLPTLEHDLGASAPIRALVRSDLFAALLYGALCNTQWKHTASGVEWSCSWRSAGGIVATLRGEGDYLDWYCATGEGLVDEQVVAEIRALGWELVEAEPPGQ
jgi:hypothetical protein